MTALTGELTVEIPSTGRDRPGGWARVIDALGGLVTRVYPPAVALAVVDSDGAVFQAWGGFGCIVGDPVPLERDTLFDLASLTKVVASVPLAALLAERGAWSFDDPVRSWVPGFPRREITLFHLLTHTSGLVAHRPFFETLRGRTAIRRAIFAEAVEAGLPGQVLYSDLNFMLLGWAIEACGGDRLDQLVRRELTSPLGMPKTRFVPSPGIRRRCAATELDGDQRNEPGLIWGEVHDGNAWALGGVSGHAGVFAPLDDLVNFVRPLLDRSAHPVLSVPTIERFSEPSAGGAGDVRSIGWRLEPEAWGPWSEATYWHTGFTGTSLLVDPLAGIAVVLLMNGVHPIRRPEEQAQVRAELHRLIAEECR
jgi:CubicO group peptidase (beta-lactamase class C family)